MRITLNGQARDIDVDPEKPLLWILRDDAAHFSSVRRRPVRASSLASLPSPTLQPASTSGLNPFSEYLQISPDETVTIFSSQMDMGQGIYHGLATLVQEELDADWTKVPVDGGFGNPALYGNLALGGKVQFTGGSSGTASSWERYRRAGATARAMLVAAAAEQWNVPVREVSTKNGVVSHASGKSTTYGALVSAAAARPVPDVALKQPQDWKYVGAETLPRYDSGPKSTGRQQYTIDLREPGMLTAVMIHPPRFGANLKSFEGSKAKQMKGVVDVVATPRGIAVVATGMWEAMKAREAVSVEWDESHAETRSSSDLIAEYRAAADKGAPTLRPMQATWRPHSPRRRRCSRRATNFPISRTRRWSRSTQQQE